MIYFNAMYMENNKEIQLMLTRLPKSYGIFSVL